CSRKLLEFGVLFTRESLEHRLSRRQGGSEEDTAPREMKIHITLLLGLLNHVKFILI
ncbi:hypothetical protein L9F63_005856, partial [Diploptera punctata]